MHDRFIIIIFPSQGSRDGTTSSSLNHIATTTSYRNNFCRQAKTLWNDLLTNEIAYLKLVRRSKLDEAWCSSWWYIYIYYILSKKKKRNATCEKISFTSNFQHHFKYRNKHNIKLTFGTLVVQTLKFITMSKFITLKSIVFRWRHFKVNICCAHH